MLKLFVPDPIFLSIQFQVLVKKWNEVAKVFPEFEPKFPVNMLLIIKCTIAAISIKNCKSNFFENGDFPEDYTLLVLGEFLPEFQVRSINTLFL